MGWIEAVGWYERFRMWSMMRLEERSSPIDGINADLFTSVDNISEDDRLRGDVQ
jgi:hypothetical protein